MSCYNPLIQVLIPCGPRHRLSISQHVLAPNLDMPSLERANITLHPSSIVAFLSTSTRLTSLRLTIHVPLSPGNDIMLDGIDTLPPLLSLR